jgi:hypothetical protein
MMVLHVWWAVLVLIAATVFLAVAVKAAVECSKRGMWSSLMWRTDARELRAKWQAAKVGMVRVCMEAFEKLALHDESGKDLGRIQQAANESAISPKDLTVPDGFGCEGGDQTTVTMERYGQLYHAYEQVQETLLDDRQRFEESGERFKAAQAAMLGALFGAFEDVEALLPVKPPFVCPTLLDRDGHPSSRSFFARGALPK